MRVGIIVHSQSGHTLAVAQKLEEKLAEEGHDVSLNRVEAAEPTTSSACGVAPRTKPAAARYEKIVFGSPVRGGELPPPMARYLDQVSSLGGKPVAFLLTHFLRRAWGTEQTIAQMTELCESKGATVVGSADVRWPNLQRGRDIQKAVDKLGQLLASAPSDGRT